MSFSDFFSHCLNHLSIDARNCAADLRLMFRQLKSLLANSAPRRRSLRSVRAAAWLSISPGEMLEQRINLASFSLSGTSGSGTATITLASNESLTVLANTSSSYTFTLGSGSWTGTAANGVSASGTTLTAGSAAQTFYSTFTITKASATTGTAVTFSNSGTTNTFKDNFNVTLAGTGAAGAITFNGTTSFASSSGLTISTNRNIVFSASSSLLTVNGNISLDANPTTAASAVYDGIALSGATVKSTGTGNITLAGRGGAGANTAEENRGIDILASSLIETNSGNITLTGNGGLYDGTGDFCIAGINLDTSDIRSTSGNISLTGNGSSTGSATVGDCDGVNLEIASDIVTGSTGSVSIIGNAKRSGEGVDIQDNTNNTVVSGSGGIVISGSATSSNGLQLAGSGNTYLLLNALSGPIQLTGSSETGDALSAQDFKLGDGTVTNVTLTATGGSVTASGDDDGLDLVNVSGVITGTLTINSTSGDTGESEIISSSLQAATISITATTGNSDGLNINASTLNSTGNMTISGSCTGGTGDNDGIYISSSSSLTATNTLSLTGTAKDGGEAVDFTSSTITAATVQITGTGVNSYALQVATATINATNLTVIANTANNDAVNSSTGTYTITGDATFTSACSGGSGDNDGAWFSGGTITVGGNLSINSTAAADGEGLEVGGVVVIAASISLNVAASTTAGAVIVLYNGASFTATGAAGVTATATGTGGSGIRLEAASLIGATTGPINFSSNRPIVLDTGDVKSDGAGSITLTSDTITLSGVGAEINAGTGTVTILTKTANYPIQLGAIDSPTALALESSELGLITAGSLIIGSSANTQPITLSANTSPALAGNLTLRTAGGVQPAATADDLTLASVKTVSFGSSTPLNITIAGSTPDTGYDRLNVSTKVNLTNASLSLTGAYTPVAGDVFTIVNAPGGLSGIFNSLANGSTVSFNGRTLIINYSATTVTLTDPAPVVTTAPTNLTITYGSTASFTAAASGVPAPTVQWQQNDGSGWTNISGGTGTTLSLTPTVSQSGYLYRAIFTNTYGNATTAVATLTVNQASSTTSVASSANPSTFGGLVTFTATVTSGATGTVTFKDGTTTLGTGTIASGTATFSTAGLTAGSHSLTAVYNGDSNYVTSTSSALTQVVNQASTTTSVASSANPGSFGSSVTFTATVTSGASGTVTFKNGTTTLGTGTITAGTATFSTSSLNAGSHTITAVYGGDPNYATSTSSALTQVVNQASTTTSVASSANPGFFGSSVTFTATVTSGASGTVTFRNGTTTLGTGTITAGTATFSTSSLNAGSHTITAVYAGDSNYASSTSTAVTQVINQASTTTSVASSATPSSFGSSVTFTATITSGATGTVTFKDGTTTLGTGTIASGTATFSTSSLTAGSHSITAVYDGDSNYATSTSSAINQTVSSSGISTTTSLASSLNPSSFGSSVTFTATVTSGATGTVTFRDGATTLGTGTLASGIATFTTSSLNAGTLSITATFDGDGTYASSTSNALTQTVSKASTTTTVTPSWNPSTVGLAVTLTARTTAGATGNVTFRAGATTIGTGTITAGTATLNTTSLTIGVHSITAVYEGDSNYLSSTSSAFTQVVTAAPVITGNPVSQAAAIGATCTFTASATGSPAPTVQWQISTNGGTTWANISGATSTTFTTPTLVAGNDGAVYRAVFTNSSGVAVTTTALLHVNQAPTVTSNPADTTASPGSTARFTAAATGWPVPTVQWQKNSGSGWSNISGETGLAYTTSALTVADSGTQFRAVFTNTYGTVNSSTATLTVASVAAITNVAVGWGSQTADLSEASGGRLLPAGRNNTLPWLGIQQIALTFDQPVPTLAVADIQLTSAGGFTYGITSVTGSGTRWTINLSSGGLANADRVTVSVRNSSVASWNRRLDVLPGDVNDDATVTSVDQLLVSRQVSLTYIKFYDIDGNGLLTAIDFSLIKSRIGKKLP